MSRAFLILTTQPQPNDTDPSERTAVLAARREEALEARAASDAAGARGAGAGRGGAPARATQDRARLRGPAGPDAHVAGPAPRATRALTQSHPRCDAAAPNPQTAAAWDGRRRGFASSAPARVRRGDVSAFDDLLPGLDARFERLAREAAVPGVAWGVVRDGLLVHSGGAGTIRDGEDRRPDADSVYRIASMTKSFTAATVLLLRDEGRLRLDDPVADHVPALADWAPPTADSPAVTIRDLLTMSAGLPTDDPWGDRQQGLAARRLRPAPRRRPVVRLAARRGVRVLQPRLRHPRPGHHQRVRPRVPRRRP